MSPKLLPFYLSQNLGLAVGFEPTSAGASTSAVTQRKPRRCCKQQPDAMSRPLSSPLGLRYSPTVNGFPRGSSYSESAKDDPIFVSSAGFEPATPCLGGMRSVQLSYEDPGNSRI